jgi:hypothetical protein
MQGIEIKGIFANEGQNLTVLVCCQSVHLLMCNAAECLQNDHAEFVGSARSLRQGPSIQRPTAVQRILYKPLSRP